MIARNACATQRTQLSILKPRLALQNNVIWCFAGLIASVHFPEGRFHVFGKKGRVKQRRGKAGEPNNLPYV